MTDRVQIIRPPNTLAKAKTGSGKGVIDHEAIARAEAAIEQVGKSFQDWASADLAAMEAALEAVKSEPSQHDVQIREIYRRAMDLKGQGGTFGFVLITEIGQSLKTFTEGLDTVGGRDVGIILAHIGAMKTVLLEGIRGDGGDVGRAIVAGLAKLVDGA